MEDQELVPGFVFKPTSEILVNHFLRRRIVDGLSSAPDYLIKEFNVYSTEPWNLPGDSFRYQDEDGGMLFFTPRHPTTPNSKRADRTAGIGFWDGNGKDRLIKIGSDVIGHKTSLNFKINKGDEKIKTDWIMHEFRLSRSSSSTAFDDLVLCRVHEKKKRNKNDDGNKRYREQEEEAEQSLLKRRCVEGEEPASFPSSSSSASSLMTPAFESVEGYEAPLALDDSLFLEEAVLAPDDEDGELFLVDDIEWENMLLSWEDFVSYSNDKL